MECLSETQGLFDQYPLFNYVYQNYQDLFFSFLEYYFLSEKILINNTFELNNNNNNSIIPIKSQFAESLNNKINKQFSTLGFTLPLDVTSKIIEDIFKSINSSLTPNVQEKFFKHFCSVYNYNDNLCEFFGNAQIRITLSSLNSKSYLIFDGFITLNLRKISKLKEEILEKFITTIGINNFNSKVDDILINYSDNEINDELINMINSYQDDNIISYNNQQDIK